MFFSKKAFKWGQERMLAAERLHELASDTANGINEIKIFSSENYFISKVRNTITRETSMFHLHEMYQISPRFIVETLFLVTLSLFFCVYLFVGVSPAIVLGQFSVIAAGAFRILPSINRIINAYSNFSFHIAPSLSVLNKILSTQSELSEHASSRDMKEQRNINFSKLEFKNLYFKYPLANRMLLENVNLTVNCGQRVGIMGDSGSGKSTFIDILAGFYLPVEGEVLVDGESIYSDLTYWRNNLGYIPQKPFILPETIRNNLCFGSFSVYDDALIWGVLEMVGLSDMVSNLDEKLDAKIGERGILLSGGQKQLLCIARTLIRRPKIILLDEPTASLDVASEQVVLNVINKLQNNCTIIMISHKIENFKFFDVIYKCEKGLVSLAQKKDRLLSTV